MSKPVIAAHEALSPGPVVRFTDVGMRYGRQAETLRDVSFSLAPGSLTILTGASGRANRRC
jgi:ABC-type ATPase involved in cell division